jgi:hypothetical protein
VSTAVVSTVLASGLCTRRALTFRSRGGESSSRSTTLSAFSTLDLMALGLFAPKPGSYFGTQVLSVGWPAGTVRGCPRESADEHDDHHSASHSTLREIFKV